MQYLLLIHGDPEHWAGLPEEEQNAMLQEFGEFTGDLRESGAYVGGNRLEPGPTASTVRVRDGETIVSDGPFAETKEQLGGYYLIESESIDEALEWAARIPVARYGSIEVRPVAPVPARA
jgi:hypothetical protein